MSCPQCFSGHVHDDIAPTGREDVVHGRKTYVTEPGDGISPKGIIIIVPDAFGWQFVNNRILADHYASKGKYLVYLPDFMDGRPAPVWMIDVFVEVFRTGSIGAWLQKPYYVFQAIRGFVPFLITNRYSISMPKVKSFFDSTRSNEAANLPIGAAGFCWGGKHAINLAAVVNAGNGKPLADAVFIGHPSQLDVPKEVEGVTKPVSIAIGDKDDVVPLPQVMQIKRILADMDVETEVKIYPGAGHGFCIRADPLNQHVTQQSLEAEEQALMWFDRYLGSIKY